MVLARVALIAVGQVVRQTVAGVALRAIVLVAGEEALVEAVHREIGKIFCFHFRAYN